MAAAELPSKPPAPAFALTFFQHHRINASLARTTHLIRSSWFFHIVCTTAVQCGWYQQ